MTSQPSIIYSEHAQDILAAATALAEQGKRFALVVSLNIEGGAARSVGSLAIVSEDQHMTGYLSNGCIDRDIILQSVDALDKGAVRTVLYGTGSPYMDIQLPCGGALEILIDPNPSINLLRGMYEKLCLRESAVLVFSKSQGLIELSQTQGDAKQFIYAPKPRLLLAGRGAIMLTTAKLAKQMDFELAIASPDEVDLAVLGALEPEAIYPMKSLSQKLELDVDANTAVMLLFHDHEWEQSILMNVAHKAPFFLGAMGSRNAQAMRLAGLEEAGMEKDDLERIRGPIGLVPSLRNASLIAVSALAEVVAAMPISQQEL